jgi:hypothetical protein
MHGALGQGRNGQQSSTDVKDSKDLIWFGVGEGVVSLMPMRIAQTSNWMSLRKGKRFRFGLQSRLLRQQCAELWKLAGERKTRKRAVVLVDEISLWLRS